MKKNYILLAVCTILGFMTSVHAQKQKAEVLNYDWGEPVFEEFKGPAFDTVEAYVLKSVSRLEFVYNSEGELEGYRVRHEKVKINKDNALDNYNKFRFSMNSYNEILTLKARFISKDGKVISLDKSDAKTVEDKEDKTSYKLLAIEGAAVGGIIEYYWVSKGYRSLFNNFTIQESIPQKNVQITISSPLNLRFIAKSYNGCPDMLETIDSTSKRRTLALETPNVPALQKEKYAGYQAHLQRVEYTFAYNYANSSKRVYDKSEAAQRIYNIVSLEKNEEKLLKSIIKKIDISNKMSTEEKIKQIEKYIKTNFQLIDQNVQGVDLSAITDITATKYASPLGYVRMMTGAFRYYEIPFELVLTTEKNDKFFDKDFDGFNYLDKYIFYFPEINKYLDPNSYTRRLGYIDREFLGNYGLFLKTIQASGIESFMPYVKQIPINDFTKAYHNTNVDIKLNVNDFKLDYTVDNIFADYECDFYQPFFHFAENDAKQNLLDEILQTDKASNKLIDYQISNEKPDNWYVKPFSIKAHLSGDKYISRAGKNITFNIGMLIGRQSEMYRENTRILPIEYDVAHSYGRELKFEIPEGYEISNPEVLKMKAELSMNNQIEAYFYSDYKIVGNQLVVTSSEAYKQLEFPIEKYNEFVAIINAAADFNKITLILKPKM